MKSTEGGVVCERTPLLGGSTIVTITSAPAPSNTLAGGMTLRTSIEEHPGGMGLVSEAQADQAEQVCCGQEQTMYHVLARLPALHTFGFLAFFLYFGHVWLLMQRPDIAVWIIGAFITYGVFRFYMMWFGAWNALFLLRKNDVRDPDHWQKQMRPLGSMAFDAVWHAVILPNYKEPVDKLRQTLDTIASQSIAHHIVVCMGMEARDPNAVAVAELLQKEYAGKLGGFCYSLHPITDGETPGKSSNENWAARCVAHHMVEGLRIPIDCITITTCDADTFFHPNHFSYLTHQFISDGEERYHKFYMAVTNFQPNVGQVPAICATRFTVLSVGRMAEMGNPLLSPFPLAIYSLSLRLAKKAAFWDPTVIPEDWHMYFRCMYADGGNVSATKLMITVGTECVQGSTYMHTIQETYDQSVRWQWGAIDVGYLLVQTFARWDTPILKRIQMLYAAYDHHLLAVVICVVLVTAPFLYGKIPIMVNLNMLTGAELIVPLKTIMVVVWAVHFGIHFLSLCYMDYTLRNDLLKGREHYETQGPHSNGPVKWISLLLFPLADIFLFVIPTMHAHLKMFISSNFNYVPSAKLGARCPNPCGGEDLGNDKDV